jgi:hypothetical protein
VLVLRQDDNNRLYFVLRKKDWQILEPDV